MITLLSISSAAANDISTNATDYVIDNTDLVIPEEYSGDTVAIANSAGIQVNVRDSYVSNSNTWEENGIAAPNSRVTVYDSSNSIVYQGYTNSKGSLLINNLNQGKYTIKILLDTYEEYSQNINLGSGKMVINHIFYPDILFFVDYTSHYKKLLELTNISKRVCYVSTTNFDATKSWLFEHANFIMIDMYTDSGAYSFNMELVKDSPAQKNYKIAYTFGEFDKSLIDALGLHFVGGSPSKNTPNSLENTYIGSYFQAEDTTDNTVMKKNMANLVDYIKYLINSAKYANPTIDPSRTPLIASTIGIYHPDFGSLTVSPSQQLINSWIKKHPGYDEDGIGSLNWMTTEYKKWKEDNVNIKSLYMEFESWYKKNKKHDKPFIIVASYYAGGPLIDALIHTYEANGRPAFNVFQSVTSPSMSSLLLDITSLSTIGVSAINSLYSWSLDYDNMGNNKSKDDLTDLDLVLLKAVNDISQKSYDSILGPQMEWTYSVTIPSFEGVFGAVVLSYITDLGETVVIQSGVDKLVKMTMEWAKLKEKNNYDKKISIILYNYPPGKAEIGASYLDVFQSTYDLLLQLYDQGYYLGTSKENLPSLKELTELIIEFGNKGTWAQGLLNQYVEKYWDMLMANNQLISLEQFYNLTSGIDKNLMKEVIDRWGDGLGNIMVYNDTYLVIPGIQFGNVFITFQPSRGWEEVQNYHDTTLPPHQQYIAFYEWLDKAHKTDAIIYMGTHGTLEFMPGHQIGVQEGDWTFELTLTPSIYLYIVSNPGEAMVARDRLAALMITHMTPAIVQSELYGDYRNLSNAIYNYENSIKLDVPENAEIYKSEIIGLAKKLGFEEMAKGQSFEDWLNDLHNYLDEMQNDFNALGLHTIGKILSGDELIEEVITIVTSQTTIYNDILHLLFPYINLDYYKDIKGNRDYDLFDNLIRSWLHDYVDGLVNGYSVESLNTANGVVKNTELYNTTFYIQQVINNIRSNNEWNALFKALNGSYLEAGLFADPAYSSSLPTGYNGYATDSTKIPSKVAFMAAKKIVDMLLVDYYEKNGKWPELVGLVLWGTEILRTEGIGIGEFLYLLGCEPIWSASGTVTGVRLLPLSELTVTLSNGKVVNRPRVDVYASMVTSNVDWITWMLTATKLAVFAQGEDSNHNFAMKHYILNPTLDRLFGLPGNVLEGTGVSNLIPSTSDWDISNVNDKLAGIYMDRVSNSWSLDENGNIVIHQEKKNFEFLLRNTDLITQNFDSTWRLFDSDDYYDWFGGLLNAARHFGANPDTAFVDIRNKNNYVVRDYDEEIEFEIRSLLTNPKYLDEWGKSEAGMNAWASRYQNMYGSLIVGSKSLNQGISDQLASSIMYMSQYVNGVGSAAAWQSSAAWMMYLAKQGMSSLDSKTVSELANQMISYATQYGVACCHHTCKNLEFNKWLLQVSTLSEAEKQKYAEVLAQATLTDSIYTASESANPDSSNNEANNGNTVNNGNNMENENSANSQQSNTQGIGIEGSQSESVASEVSSQSYDSQSAGDSASESSSTAYEITKESTSLNISSESSMPAFFIVAVIVIILLFVAGYRRNKKED